MNLSLTEAYDNFMQLPEILTDVATVTQLSEPVLAIIPWEIYEGILETLEILADPEMMDSIKRGLHDVEEGKTIDLERVIADLEKTL